MENSDYIIIGDTEKYAECLVCICGKDILLPEYSEVVAWMHIPMPYDGE